MTIDVLVALIISVCGPSEKCWDYYNNCVHNRGLTEQNFEQCKANRVITLLEN